MNLGKQGEHRPAAPSSQAGDSPGDAGPRPSATLLLGLCMWGVLPRVYRGRLKVPYATDTCKPDSEEDVRVTEMTRLEPGLCACLLLHSTRRWGPAHVSHQHSLSHPNLTSKHGINTHEHRNEKM